MQRAQVIDAGKADVSTSRDDGAAMASALHRLAALRATIYRDWSEGPSSLVAYANVDAATVVREARARVHANDQPPLAFADDPAFSLELAPLDLRGRFDCDEDMPPATVAPPVAEDEEDVVTFSAVGAAAGLAAFLTLADLPAAAPAPQAPAPLPDLYEDEVVEAYGAAPGLIAWLDAPLPSSPPSHADVVAPADVEEVADAPAVGAVAGALALETPLLTATPPAPPIALTIEEDEVDETHAAVGAVASCLTFDAPLLPMPTTGVAAPAIEVEESAPDMAIGAAPDLAALLDLAPAPDLFTPPPIVDLEVVALDDLLADACEALYVAALDPTEHYAWGASVLPEGDGTHIEMLADCEVAFWNLPRVVPCGEAFALNPNHEIAVKITRALRVRADTLRARAFTEHAAFGALRTVDSYLPWFPSVETPVEAGSGTVDADTQFAAWSGDDLATIISAPDRAMPLLSEDELDALLATPAARDSHELDDAWQESPVWQETFWHDVDAYLQSVEGADFDEAPEAPIEVAHPQDIEFREEQIAATHFWLPGDEADLAITGEGHDLFLVGGGDAGVALVEGGAIHSMRTGRGTRMGEIVVSWSTDAWTDIDMMTWVRVATLSNISQVRVEQTVTHDRAVVIAGDLSGSTLTADCVRLTEATEHGPREFPVRRLGGAEADESAWPFADLGGGGADQGRIFV